MTRVEKVRLALALVFAGAALVLAIPSLVLLYLAVWLCPATFVAAVQEASARSLAFAEARRRGRELGRLSREAERAAREFSQKFAEVELNELDDAYSNGEIPVCRMRQ